MLAGLENSAFSVWAKGSLWGSPALLTIHVLGTALVIGMIVIIHLRLLGLFDSIAYTSLRRLFPALWVGFAVQLFSGAALWATKATQYTVDVAFLVKLVLVVAGFILALVLYGSVKREAVSWAADTAAPRRFKAVLPSLLVWCAVIIFARLTAFLGALNIPGIALDAPDMQQRPPVAANTPVDPKAPPQRLSQVRNDRKEVYEGKSHRHHQVESDDHPGGRTADHPP
jgi:hypothetical protein